MSEFAEVLDHFATDWRDLASLCGGVAFKGDGIETVISGIQSPVFNRILAVRAPQDPEGSLSVAIAHMDERSLPFALEVFPPAKPVGRAALAAGLTLMGEQPFMIHPDPSAVRVRAPEGVEIRPVETAAELEVWAFVAAEGFGMRADHVMALAPAATWLRSDRVRAFIAYDVGAAVATSLSCYGDGACGVYTVATLVAARRRGIGEAVTAAAILEGNEHGCEIAYLQASDKGYPVYQKMGFEEVFRSGFFLQSTTT